MAMAATWAGAAASLQSVDSGGWRLRQLERENVVLQQEREILKRAAAFFIRESDRP